MRKNRLRDEYCPEPPDDFDVEKFEAEVEREEDPYNDYEIYTMIVVERVEKHVNVLAASPEDAERQLESYLDKVDMSKDVDSYERFIETWEYGDTGSYGLVAQKGKDEE